MAEISSICVYCGSRYGRNSNFKVLAKQFGVLMAHKDIGLVYGGGDVGLMGVLARSVMESGGRVTGIIPEHLEKAEVGLKTVTNFHVVDNMHDRKRMMFDHSDAFVVLPGSIGTLDETIEVLTWKQLKLHDKPIVIVNSQGYWQPFLKLIDHVIDQEFTSPMTKNLFHIVERIEDVIPLLISLPKSKIDPKNTLI